MYPLLLHLISSCVSLHKEQQRTNVVRLWFCVSNFYSAFSVVYPCLETRNVNIETQFSETLPSLAFALSNRTKKYTWV